jgi:class 3 adenylate cyclase/HAMP domain-containing protein
MPAPATPPPPGNPVATGVAALPQGAAARGLRWLVPLVALIHLAGLVLLASYSALNLRPDLPAAGIGGEGRLFALAALLATAVPTAATWLYMRPIRQWSARSSAGWQEPIPPLLAQRCANLPLVAAAQALVCWILLVFPALLRGWAPEGGVSAPLLAHLVLRPVLVGLVVAATVLFVTEAVCRATLWPSMLGSIRITGNRQLWRLRTGYRLMALWMTVSVIPLGAVALTTYARGAGADIAADPLLGQIVSVVLLIALSFAVGGAVLAWTVSRSITRPLQALETATQALSAGHFDTRVVVNATDEFGTLAEGFNLAAQRLSRSYADLETRNRELADALDRVAFLEHVKHALDRFVPETVRHAIEQNPDAPGLAKEARDVTVLFLDIEGYSRLSEELPRNVLNTLVERYFSLFLESIRAQGGDINETAGDGLMIIFQSPDPQAHPAAALRAALAIQQQTAEANRAEGAAQTPVRINIGISSGECDVGTTRFQGLAGERWTFTASGPVTNLAARLSDRAHGGQILVSAETARRLQGRFALRSAGELALHNLSSPVVAWEACVPTVP